MTMEIEARKASGIIPGSHTDSNTPVLFVSVEEISLCDLILCLMLHSQQMGVSELMLSLQAFLFSTHASSCITDSFDFISMRKLKRHEFEAVFLGQLSLHCI